jgi:opacity protein-like surface antigen
MRGVLLALALLATGTAVAGEAWSGQRLYLGGGFGNNKVPEFDEVKTGIQLFAGYNLADSYGLDASRFSVAVEAGYIDISDADHDGLWVTPVLSGHVAPQTELFIRAGGEAGDDSGLVYGGGVGYHIERNMAVRLEYVEHPDAHSLQFNLVYYPWSRPYFR